MHILKLHIYAYLVLHICAYLVHISAYGICAYIWIFCFCIFFAYLCLLCTYIAYFLFAYLCIFLHIWYCILPHINLHIMAYLPVCIFKQITHMFACKMQIYSYFLYLCIFGSAYCTYISYSCICLIFLAYSSIFLLPRPISLMNIQTATGVRR